MKHRRAFPAMAVILFVAAAVLPLPALHEGYYNHPDIHGDTIVFSAEGDLWRVSAGGGVASRLTRDAGVETHPRISPDGEWIAFAGEYDGNTDVYIMPFAGGTPRRLTYHPYSDVPTGWTPDSRHVLMMSARAHPHLERRTFKVSIGGGVPAPLPMQRAAYLTMDGDGRTVLFNRSLLQVRTWKRYGGGLAEDIWQGDLETGEFRRLTTYFGNDLSPIFAGGRIVFLSERDGRLNVWSLDRDGDDLEQHTKFEDFDARSPQGDGGPRVVFQQGADIWLLDLDLDEARRIEIRLPTDRVATRERFPSAAEFIETLDIDNAGTRVLAAVRGGVYQVPVRHGRPFAMGAESAIRQTGAVFAGADHEKVVYYSDQTGEYDIYRADARTGDDVLSIGNPEGTREGTLQPFFALEVSPNGHELAFSTPEGRLYHAGVTTPTLHLIEHNRVWEIRQYAWSPDSRYLAYSAVEWNDFSVLRIYDSVTREVHDVTSRMHDSTSPAWDPGGDCLFYLSARTFNRMGGAFEYENVMIDPAKVYAILLNNDVENPFHRLDPYEEMDKEEDEDSNEDEDEEGEKEKDEDEAGKEKEVQIDFDGILQRHIAFPMDSGNLYSLAATKDRVLYQDVKDGKARLMVFDYRKDKPEAKVFAPSVRGYVLSRNGEHLLYRTDDGVRVTKASAEKADGEDAAPAIGALRLVVDPLEEWSQIYVEVARYYRDFFYSPTMGNLDWEGIARRYRSLLGRVSMRQELNDLLGNLIGELGHGHTYIWGEGDAPAGPSVPTGLLGVDFEADPEVNLIRIAKIYRGEPWDPALKSPFHRTSAREVKDGWYLHAINGARVTAADNPLHHLRGMDAGHEVLLRLSPDGDGDNAKDYRVALISDERGLRLYDWIQDRRRYTADRSNGRLGYIYLPNMGTDGLVHFYRDYFPQIDREGMVVDIRFNGGGNVSQLIVRRLNQELYAMMKPGNFDQSSTYPARVFTGPMACLINERCGSDGDIFAHSFRHFELGPLIGTTTWGGTIGIRFRTRLVDGGQITVPEFAFYALDRGFEIENHGVEPDEGFEVFLDPGDEWQGRDPQLDRAIAHLMEQLETGDFSTPVPGDPYPDRSVESFRERSREWMTKP